MFELIAWGLIGLAPIVIGAIIGKRIEEYSGDVAGGAIGFIVSCIMMVFLTSHGYAQSVKSYDETYPIPIVSLSDGTGIKGEIRGRLFAVRGQVGDTQHFSYYQKNADGSYALNKRPAPQSSIWMDTAAENARIDVVDRVTTCKQTVLFPFCNEDKPLREFVHAHFHVPEGSIGEEYELDAK